MKMCILTELVQRQN